MVYTIEQLAKLDLERSKETVTRSELACIKCKANLDEVYGYRVCSDGPRCEDCYFDELGDAMEQYPIGLPSMRR